MLVEKMCRLKSKIFWVVNNAGISFYKKFLRAAANAEEESGEEVITSPPD